MKDFNYFAPTQVVFGKDAESRTGQLVRQYGGTKVLVVYGGGSAVRSGVLQTACERLSDEGIPYHTLGGVVPNPRVGLVRQGIDLCRREGIDFLLAVGGGSVLDTCKGIAVGVPYEGDVWDFPMGRATVQACLPIGAVLTLPAAGSEMSNSCVLSQGETGAEMLKKGFNTDLMRCRFAVMNPERTYTLPPYQTACGIVDILMHIMERYFTHDTDMEVTDALSEALMRTVQQAGRQVMLTPDDYVCRAQIMWAGSLAHNGLLGCGHAEDWGTHKLEHELSALFDVAHGAGLAAVWGSWARYVCHRNVERFVRYATHVMGIAREGRTDEEVALEGIAATERFFASLCMPVTIGQLTGREVTDDEIRQMAYKASWEGTRTVGSFMPLAQADMETIYRMAR